MKDCFQNSEICFKKSCNIEWDMVTYHSVINSLLLGLIPVARDQKEVTIA